MRVERFLQYASKQTPSNIRWRHRRRLVYIGFTLGVFMILFGLATFWWDRQVSSEAIIAGTAIVTLLLGAYVGAATVDDVKLSGKDSENSTDGIDNE